MLFKILDPLDHSHDELHLFIVVALDSIVLEAGLPLREFRDDFLELRANQTTKRLILH